MNKLADILDIFIQINTTHILAIFGFYEFYELSNIYTYINLHKFGILLSYFKVWAVAGKNEGNRVVYYIYTC